MDMFLSNHILSPKSVACFIRSKRLLYVSSLLDAPEGANLDRLLKSPRATGPRRYLFLPGSRYTQQSLSYPRQPC